MRSNESTRERAFAREYALALREYTSGGGEAALTRAYELGRSAAGAGLGILDLATWHHDALRELPAPGGGDRRALDMAAQFLAESLSPFEMTLRSYQANARLLGLSETLAQQNVEIDRAREQLRTILDATTAVIYLKDAGGRYLFVNRQFQEVFRVGREEVIGRTDEEALPPQVARTLQAKDAAVLDERAPRQLEEAITTYDGPRTYLSLKFPLLDAEGKPYGICCVATDITERKRAEEALLQAKEAAVRERHLRQTLQARDAFLDVASHELKTPLTSLELHVEGLRRLARSSPDTLVSDPRAQSKCDVIVQQVKRLTVLIERLIDVGKITSGSLELCREGLDLGELVRGILTASGDAIRLSGSAVVARYPESPLKGLWDRPSLETAIASVVSNAVKFGDGKPIEVQVHGVDGHAIVRVRDHGIGIREQDQRRIFERFERAVSERHFGGFGLGLWMARKAVEAHGGTLRVKSSEGGGSEFTVELPLEGAAGRPS